MFLDAVLREKREQVARWKSLLPLRELKKRMPAAGRRPFREQFSSRFPTDVRIIAELKKASPSKGLLRPDFDPVALARRYVDGGARALSVITEERHFQGSLDYLAQCREAVELPLLRKDFIVDEYELYQAKAAGADAVLLIGEALENTQAAEYLACAAEVGLDVLFEVHGRTTFDKIAGLSGFVLGINNRDLTTLAIDLGIARTLIAELPPDMPVVVESGIETRQDVEGFRQLGVSGFLIGTGLVRSEDPASLLRELRGAA